MTTRIEAARVSLRMRARRMRRDADQLWQRSVWAYRSALAFFLLAIAGPAVGATLLLRAAALDWHLMFGGLGLAAVPLTIGTALLRWLPSSGTNSRWTTPGSARSPATTRQQVITQLLTLPPASTGTAPAALGGKEDVESQVAITAVATKPVDAVTTTLGQKKS